MFRFSLASLPVILVLVLKYPTPHTILLGTEPVSVTNVDPFFSFPQFHRLPSTLSCAMRHPCTMHYPDVYE